MGQIVPRVAKPVASWGGRVRFVDSNSTEGSWVYG